MSDPLVRGWLRAPVHRRSGHGTGADRTAGTQPEINPAKKKINMRRHHRASLHLLFMLLACAAASGAEPRVLFRESFDDGRRFKISGNAQSGKGCIEYGWRAGAMKFNQFLLVPYFGPGLPRFA